MYRGGAQRTARSPFRGPTHMRVRWETELQHEICASPAVGPDGTIYVGAGPIFYALNPRGEILWRHDFVESGHATEHSECFTSPSPALGNDGTIYQPGGLAGKGFVIALDSRPAAEERVRWAFDVGHEMRSSPLLVDGLSYVGCRVQRMIVALDPLGTSLWGDVGGAFNNVTSSPALSRDGRTLYIGGFDGRLHAISRKTGQERWSVGRTEKAGIRLAERDDDGNVLRHFTTAGHIPESPAVGEDGTIYFGSWDGHLYAASPQGELKWSIDLMDRVTSAPALTDDGRVLVSTFEGTLFSVRVTAREATVDWSAEANARYSSPLVSADKRVYVGTLDGKLRAYSLEDGEMIGEVSLEGWVYGSPVPGGDGIVYVGSSDGYLRAIE